MENYILTDLHIEESEQEFFKLKRAELLKQNIEDILKNKPKRVFLIGDIFNKDNIKANGYAAQLFINEIVLPIISKGIELHIDLGNHERGGKSDAFAFLKGEISNPLIHIYDSITHMEFDDFNSIFIPFMYKGDRDVNTVIKLQEIIESEISEMVSKIKNENKEKPLIIFNHNMMSDLPFDNGKEMNIKFWEIGGVDYVFGGHIHKHEIFKKGDKEKGMYVGSLMKSFVYEEESEGYVGFDINEKKEIITEYYENKSYGYEKLEIRDTIQFDPDIIKENTVYDINFFYTSQSVDDFFVQNVFSEIANKNSHIKTYSIINEESDINLSKSITLITSDEEILKDFFSDNKIKDKETKIRYEEKLKQCKGIMQIEGKVKGEKETKSDDKILKDVKKVNDLSNLFDNKFAL